jgi:hypothetical protein
MPIRGLVEMWSYAIGLSLLVGVPASAIAHSWLLWIPVLMMGVAGGLLGTSLIRSAEEDDRSLGSVFRGQDPD